MPDSSSTTSTAAFGQCSARLGVRVVPAGVGCHFSGWVSLVNGGRAQASPARSDSRVACNVPNRLSGLHRSRAQLTR